MSSAGSVRLVQQLLMGGGVTDFFVSYNQADRAWAEWIAWQLEDAGYTTVLQAWDFHAGSNFVLDMQRAATEADRTIAVLSPDYIAAKYTQPEWAAAFGRDPTGEKGILVPVRVRAGSFEGLLPQIAYIDLVGLDETNASLALRTKVTRVRMKPAKPPASPGTDPDLHSSATPPPFPGNSSKRGDHDEEPDMHRATTEVIDSSSPSARLESSTVKEERTTIVSAGETGARTSALRLEEISEIRQRAKALIAPRGQYASLCIVVAGGPAQQIIRPSKLAAADLQAQIKQRLLFGDMAIFTDKQGIKQDGIEGDALVIAQDESSLFLNETGVARIVQPVAHKGDLRRAELSVILKEDVYDHIVQGLRLSNWVLETVDPPRLLTDFVIVGAIWRAGVFGWRTRAEHLASPQSIIGWGLRGHDTVVKELAPQKREALAVDVQGLAEDLVELFDRELRSPR